MEVSSVPGPIGLDIDEMDIDIDLGPDYTELPQAELPLTTSSEPILQAPEIIHTPLDITSEETVPHKIHIRGVDDLTTKDIRAFSSEHFTSHQPSHIEWIDDTSANIVFESSDIATDALSHFTHQSNGDSDSLHALQLRAAKPLSTHPQSVLLVRIAISTDQKRPRAYEASRFYMMHPEHDPRERRRRNSRSDGDYHRRRYGNHEHRRRRKDDLAEGFTASMYDDDAGALAARKGRLDRRSSGSSFSSGTGSGSLRGNSYRPGGRDHRGIRDRSASPGKENNSRDRIRRRTPPPRYSSRERKPYTEENATIELFPSKLGSYDIGAELRGSPKIKELFPTKKPSTNTKKKELFPLKAGISAHRRSDAFDAADETADLFASGMSVSFMDGAMDSPSTRGRLKSSDPDPTAEDLADLQRGGFSIRGAAKQANQGFSIRGKASDGGTFVKELFPGKAGNAGKELFAEKLEGRGTLRRTAADMFY
ncbi:hypothetical protein MMC30_006310 [Trapelia coarctata]|nr:hypothetical protein [Trapelia coarctata]